MEVIDDETCDAALRFMEEQVEAGNKFFVWWNGTRMHFRTHVKPELRGVSGQKRIRGRDGRARQACR